VVHSYEITLVLIQTKFRIFGKSNFQNSRWKPTENEITPYSLARGRSGGITNSQAGANRLTHQIVDQNKSRRENQQSFIRRGKTNSKKYQHKPAAVANANAATNTQSEKVIFPGGGGNALCTRYKSKRLTLLLFSLVGSKNKCQTTNKGFN
jgi:hypothetical protein